MNRIAKCIICTTMITNFFVSCSKKTDENANKNSFEMDQQRYEQQQKDNKGSTAGKVAGTAAGAGIGGAGGAAAGAGIGAAIGAVIPLQIVTVPVGAGIGAIIGGIAGLVSGGKTGYQLSNGDLSEYINVNTTFVFAQHNSEELKTVVYGSAENEASKYFLPRFPVNEEVQLTIEMNTSMLESKIKQASKRQKSSDVRIPVKVSISKSKNIEVQYDGGIQKDRTKPEFDINGDARYSFYIKNNSELHPNLKFLFTPAEVGNAEINVTYGEPENKIVDSTCDICQTLKFIEE